MLLLLASLSIIQLALVLATPVVFAPDDPRIEYFGRVLVSPTQACMDWSATGWIMKVSGTATVTVELNGQGAAFDLVVDNTNFPVLYTTSENQAVAVAPLDPTTTHTILFQKRTEAQLSSQPSCITSFTLDPTGTLLQAPYPFSGSKKRLLWIGDSITCGFGALGTPPCSNSAQTENVMVTYDVLTSQAVNAAYEIVSWSGIGVVWSYGQYNNSVTMPEKFPQTLGLEATPTWNFSSWVPDLIIINLGTNDCWSGTGPPQEYFVETYVQFVNNIRQKYYNQPDIPVIIVAGPMLPAQSPCVHYIYDSFQLLPQPITFVNITDILSSTMYGCDGHPNVQGHALMAEHLIPVVHSITTSSSSLYGKD